MLLTLRQWQQTYKDPKNFIVQASKQDGSDGWLTFPIGMGWQFAANWRPELTPKWQFGSHQNIVLCAILEVSDLRRRPIGINRRLIVSNLGRVGIQNVKLTGAQYFNDLSSYKFVISPEGNGIDCHRHYEALMAGCIPIMEDNPMVREKYRGCPILFTRDYSEINERYLEQKYNEMIDKTYDFSRLFLSSYCLEDQLGIRQNGNYWVKTFCYKNWY